MNLSSSWNSVVSLDLENSWAARSLQDALRQARYDAKFQQKQMQEKEEKLLKLYENQQQRAFERVGRGSAGSNGNLAATLSTGKVRQMFDERRQKAGIDRSYPLEPLRNNKQPTSRTSIERKNVKNSTKTSVTNRTTQRTTVQTKHEEIFNNNFEDNSYQEISIVDEADNFLKDNRDIVDMMERQDLADSLDDEILPVVEQFDEDIFTGKLANVGGKLPSQTVSPPKKPSVKSVSNGRVTNSSPKTTPTTRKETKPTAKSTVARQPVPKRTPAATPTSTPTTPAKKMNPRPSNPGGDRAVSRPPSTPVRAVTVAPPSTPPSAVRSPAGGPPVPARSPAPGPPSAARSPAPGPPSAASKASGVKRDELAACRFCRRRFASDRLQTHEDICSRTGKKKRKTYDATKHRLQGTEIEPYVKKLSKQGGKTSTNTNNSKSKQVKPAESKSNWRQKHEEFIGAIRAAKQAQAYIAKGGNLKDLPPPPPSSNPDYVQCPHCGRKFNQSAAERHIPKCATYSFNKPPQPQRPIRK